VFINLTADVNVSWRSFLERSLWGCVEFVHQQRRIKSS
jgi:hypothetical protein